MASIRLIPLQPHAGAGILASSIPARLMEAYSLTLEKGGELAALAIKRHKKQD